MQGKTVVVTGASGFIAKHIVVKLIERGADVRASVRTPEKQAEIEAVVAQDVKPGTEGAGRLRFVTLDLLRDAGWAEALEGTDALLHTASPFPMVQPKDADDIIRPAVDGTLRALQAARSAGVKRVVITSSIVAITQTALPPGRDRYTEDDWSDVSEKVTAYGRSKTLAERAAWKFVEAEAPELELTAINPGFVLGPPLDRHYGTSLSVIVRLLASKDPAIPRIGYPVSDVEDVAEAHVRALERPKSVGLRIIAADGSLWFQEMAETMREAFPERRIVTRKAPDFLIRLIGMFDSSVRTILPELGTCAKVDNGRARTVLGIDFRPARESVLRSARFLADNGLA